MRTKVVAAVVMVLWAAAGAVHAQDAHLAQQSLQCSVLMQLLAKDRLATAEQASRWQLAAQALADAHRQSRGGAALAEEVSVQMAQLQAERARQSPALVETVVQCGAWAEGFLAQGAQVRYVPVYPKVIAPALRQHYSDVARQWLVGP